jgi:hypothetical protein
MTSQINIPHAYSYFFTDIYLNAISIACLFFSAVSSFPLFSSSCRNGFLSHAELLTKRRAVTHGYQKLFTLLPHVV